MTVRAAILDDGLFRLGVKTLGRNTLELTDFDTTHITGTIGSVLSGQPDILGLVAIVVGVLAAFVVLPKGVNWLLGKYYSVTFHGIVGLVIASTILTIPFGNLPTDALSWVLHIALLIAGCICTLLLDKFNSKVEKPPVG